MELQRLSPEDWSTLHFDLQQFLGGYDEGDAGGHILEGPDATHAPPEVITQLQGDAQRLIQRAVGTREQWKRDDRTRARKRRRKAGFFYEALIVLDKWSVGLDIGGPSMGPGRDRVGLVITGSLPQVFGVVSRLTVWQEANTPIRICRYKECQQLFIAPRTDSSCCSLACTKAAWQHSSKGRRRYREHCEAQGWQPWARKNRARRKERARRARIGRRT
jgi:hypothetical protein